MKIVYVTFISSHYMYRPDLENINQCAAKTIQLANNQHLKCLDHSCFNTTTQLHFIVDK